MTVTEPPNLPAGVVPPPIGGLPIVGLPQEPMTPGEVSVEELARRQAGAAAVAAQAAAAAAPAAAAPVVPEAAPVPTAPDAAPGQDPSGAVAPVVDIREREMPIPPTRVTPAPVVADDDVQAYLDRSAFTLHADGRITATIDTSQPDPTLPRVPVEYTFRLPSLMDLFEVWEALPDLTAKERTHVDEINSCMRAIRARALEQKRINDEANENGTPVPDPSPEDSAADQDLTVRLQRARLAQARVIGEWVGPIMSKFAAPPLAQQDWPLWFADPTIPQLFMAHWRDTPLGRGLPSPAMTG